MNYNPLPTDSIDVLIYNTFVDYIEVTLDSFCCFYTLEDPPFSLEVVEGGGNIWSGANIAGFINEL